MAFQQLQTEIVESFLNTAIVVDDQLSWGEETQADPLIVPPDDLDSEVPMGEEVAQPIPSKILVEPIIEKFAESGIVCAPYKWTSDSKSLPRSSDKADLLIVDWKLESEGKAGDIASQILKDLLKKDLDSSERLRYFVIYTSEKKPEIIERLLKEVGGLRRIEASEDSNGITIRNKSGHVLWRITIISKRIDEGDLPDAIVSDFVAFVHGYLPTVVIAAIAEIRRRTYEYLYKFNTGLDSPLISHFTALKSGEKTFVTSDPDFQQYVANLLSSNFDSSLRNSKVLKKLLRSEAISGFLQKDPNLEVELYNGGIANNNTLIRKMVLAKTNTDFIEHAKSAFIPKPTSKSLGNIRDGRNPVFVSSSIAHNKEELAELDLFEASNYALDENPRLSLGTVIYRYSSNNEVQALLCIQPLCDSVRLTGASVKFPFLRLPVISGDKNFLLSLTLNGKLHKLGKQIHAGEIVAFRFKPSKRTLDVKAIREPSSSRFKFANSAVANKFYWGGQLKSIYSQEILNRLASNGSRVGSNKFEWLRMKSA